MRRALFAVLIVLAIAPVLAADQYSHEEINALHSANDAIWLATQVAATNGTWSCAPDAALCVGDTVTASTSTLVVGDKVLLLADDGKWHSYEVEGKGSGNRWNRRSILSDGTEDPLLGVAGSALYEINSGVPATTPATIRGGAGTATVLGLSQTKLALAGYAYTPPASAGTAGQVLTRTGTDGWTWGSTTTQTWTAANLVATVGAVGAGASVTESYDGAVRDYVWAGTIDHADLTDVGLTQTITVAAALPAKAVVKAAYAALVTQFDAGGAETLDFTWGVTADTTTLGDSNADDLCASTAGTVWGDEDDERGADLADADVMGAKLYSYAAATELSVTFTSVTANLVDYTAGELQFIVLYTLLP